MGMTGEQARDPLEGVKQGDAIWCWDEYRMWRAEVTEVRWNVVTCGALKFNRYSGFDISGIMGHWRYASNDPDRAAAAKARIEDEGRYRIAAVDFRRSPVDAAKAHVTEIRRACDALEAELRENGEWA